MGVAAARQHNSESHGRRGRPESDREWHSRRRRKLPFLTALPKKSNYRDDSSYFVLFSVFRGIRGSLFRQPKNDPRIPRNTRRTRKVLNPTFKAKPILTLKTFRVVLLLFVFLAALSS